MFEDEIEDDSDSLSQSTQSTQQDSKPTSKTELLDYAFKFITACKPDEEINPLLSGYFCKLMLSLLNFNK